MAVGVRQPKTEVVTDRDGARGDSAWALAERGRSWAPGVRNTRFGTGGAAFRQQEEIERRWGLSELGKGTEFGDDARMED